MLMTLILENLSHAYGDQKTLKDLSLSVSAGEVVSLLGPSGCGKTTLLRLVAGLERLSAGRIELNGKVLADTETHPAPEKRPVGLVFQEHALFPNMTVAGNIEFGLKSQSPEEREGRRTHLLHMVGLQGLELRKPGTLSGGQQQRVALARALAPAPAVMLLDEPYASIDAMLRRELRESARLLLKDAGSASILVTHDPDEALEMSDRIAVMSEGRILQVGEPDAVINYPKSEAVAGLFGEAQQFTGRIEGDAFVCAHGVFALNGVSRSHLKGQGAGLVVRPSGLSFLPDTDGGWRVRDVRFRSSGQVIFLSPADGSSTRLVRVDATSGELPEPGSLGRLELKNEHAFLFDASS